ncbi:uncharacterized protein LOC121370990 [Gigantopelta aegis]|uniref:uncharacterized protein LOC121370990 n=1 Tax=Gigantopelta aegis TaxID=1735272 RepID=UPI001B887F06|nr:uncharacterized protein LOC121370990 [Gigantopelta aegis]
MDVWTTSVLFTLLVLVPQSLSQLDQDEIQLITQAEQMPNPRRNPQACGLGQRPGFVCDPNGILTHRDIEILDWLLRGLYDNDTRCACSVYYCEGHRHQGKGFHVSLAVVRHLNYDHASNDIHREKLDAASAFARRLQRTYWRRPSREGCLNDFIILFALEDNIVFIQAGDVADAALPRSSLEYIITQHGRWFNRGNNYVTGLISIIKHMRIALNDVRFADPQGPSAQQLTGGTGQVIAGLVTSLITLAVMSHT